MTTIAVNSALGLMAGDRQFTYRGTKLMGKTKIYALSPAGCEQFSSKRVLVGFAGKSDSIGEAIYWLNNPEKKVPKVEVDMIMLNDKKQLFHASTLSNWMLLTQKLFTIGSGGDVALGAMQAGKTPIEAVKIAAKHDIYTGMGYNELSL